MKIYGQTVTVTPKQHDNAIVRAHIEYVCRLRVEYQTGITPSEGRWECVPAHEATWEDPDTGEERTAWFEEMWRYAAEVEVTDDWEEKKHVE